MEQVLAFLKKSLNIYWLRPETALLLTLQYDKIKNEDLSKGMSLDIGCGDGTFSFLLMGGEFNKNFDDYQSIKVTDEYYDGKDMFDHFKKEEYFPVIDKRPDTKIDVAIDFNESMIQKARSLELYNQIIKHDMGTTFPFSEGTFDTITGFNSLPYSSNLHKTFQEIYRVAKEGSKIYTFLSGDKMKQYRFYNLYKDHHQMWAYYIDRGRRGYGGEGVHLLSYDEYKDIIENAGLSIKKHEYFISTGCYKAWDIGFRLIFPMLKKMLDKVPKSEVGEVKDFWVEKEYEILSSYLEYETSLKADENCVFHYFVLTK
jgi:SAM-dependent methyltransferase